MSDTLRNCKETGECVVHIISDWFVEASNHSCGNFDSDADEFPLSGLTKIPSTKVTPPRVAEAAVQLECKVEDYHEFKNDSGKLTATMVIARVVLFHVNGSVYDGKNGVVETGKLRPVARLGGDAYGQTKGVFDLPRPNKDGSPGKLRFQ
jgi:flavin reductase (DIM6/NTAB) family NADH-FMN oxidoreductase RutF